ncbi:hypothetical protein HBB16_00945 [Pseudonocardia sp. MCCB 268]|nr:hypothetical protein [Pseudonocardia cytotoxica]
MIDPPLYGRRAARRVVTRSVAVVDDRLDDFFRRPPPSGTGSATTAARPVPTAAVTATRPGQAAARYPPLGPAGSSPAVLTRRLTTAVPRHPIRWWRHDHAGGAAGVRARQGVHLRAGTCSACAPAGSRRTGPPGPAVRSRYGTRQTLGRPGGHRGHRPAAVGRAGRRRRHRQPGRGTDTRRPRRGKPAQEV